jgi:hypothetical protein
MSLIAPTIFDTVLNIAKALFSGFVKHWRLYCLLILLLFTVVLFKKACRPKPLTIPVETLDKINKATRHERLEELRKTVDENADVISDVDNRTTIAEANVVERNRIAEERVQQADKQIEAAKQQGRDVTSAELECILVPEHCQ